MVIGFPIAVVNGPYPWVIFMAGVMVTLLCLSINYQASQDGGVMRDGVYKPLALCPRGKKKQIYLHRHYYSEVLRASYDCFGWEGGGWPMVALQEDVEAAVAPPLEVAAGSGGSAALVAPPLEVAAGGSGSAALVAPPLEVAAGSGNSTAVAPPLEVAAGSGRSAALATPPLEVASGSGGSAAVAAPPQEVAVASGSSTAVAPPREVAAASGSSAAAPTDPWTMVVDNPIYSVSTSWQSSFSSPEPEPQQRREDPSSPLLGQQEAPQQRGEDPSSPLLGQQEAPQQRGEDPSSPLLGQRPPAST